MPITVTADRPEELHEGIRASAKEANGKFVVEALPPEYGIDNIAMSRQKLTKYEQDLQRRDARLKGYAIDDKGTLLEPDQFQALRTEYQSLKEAQGKQPDAEKLRQAINAEAEGRWSKKYGEAESKATQLDRELDNLTLESAINALVAELGPRDGKADVVRLMLRDKLGIDKADGKRIARVRGGANDWLPGSGEGGYTTPKDWALNVLRTQHADLFRGDGQGGAGASGSGGSGRRAKYTFPRADLNGKGGDFLALQKRARAEGLEVEIVG